MTLTFVSALIAVTSSMFLAHLIAVRLGRNVTEEVQSRHAGFGQEGGGGGIRTGSDS
jgi:hypothetical protein